MRCFFSIICISALVHSIHFSGHLNGNLIVVISKEKNVWKILKHEASPGRTIRLAYHPYTNSISGAEIRIVPSLQQGRTRPYTVKIRPCIRNRIVQPGKERRKRYIYRLKRITRHFQGG
jgi:hypothetical protein